MKTLRFIKNLLCEAGKLALCGIVVAAFMGVLWCIGWVAHSLEMPVPQAMKDASNLGRSLGIFFLVVLTAFVITGIVGAWRWLRDQWQSA